jgi:hypothetical protein
MDDRIMDLAAYGCGTGAATGLAQLCRLLAANGTISGEQVENLRHLALVGFDRVREQKDQSQEQQEALAKVYDHLDSIWDRAVRAAEGQD